MRYLWIILLAGCAAAPVIRTVPCHFDLPAIPTQNTDTVPLDSDILELTKSLLIDRANNAQYRKELEAAIAGCQ